MEVILKQDLEKLGKAGSVIKVKDGYARNFLFPNGLALPLTPSNLRKLEQDKEKQTQALEKIKQDALRLKEKLDGFSLTLTVLAHEEEKLYGSIASQEIAKALKEEGFEVEESTILLAEPIKSLGIYEIPLKLHPEITANIKLWVVKK